MVGEGKVEKAAREERVVRDPPVTAMEVVAVEMMTPMVEAAEVVVMMILMTMLSQTTATTETIQRVTMLRQPRPKKMTNGGPTTMMLSTTISRTTTMVKAV